MPSPRICLVGATGAVGAAFLQVLERFRPELSSIALLASARSVGKPFEVLGRTLRVEDVEGFDFSRVDLAFFTAGSAVSRAHGPRAAAAGCIVIDNTSFFRLDADKKLVVPQVNGALLDDVSRGEIIANPNCSTIQIVKALHPLLRRFGVRDAVACTYQAASGAGAKAVDELLEHQAQPALGPRDSKYFVAPLAANVVPIIDEHYEDGWTKEELKITRESRKILGRPAFAITATAVRVPVVTGHSIALYVRTEEPASLPALREAFAGNDEVELRLGRNAPTPRFLEDRAKVYLGRVRVNPDDPRGLWVWIVADNLWVGAAYNGYQIAKYIGDRGIRRSPG